MMNIFVAIRNAIFGEPTVGNAVKDLNKALARVRKAADYQAAKAEKAAQTAKAAELASAEALKAASQAERVHGNLSTVLAVD